MTIYRLTDGISPCERLPDESVMALGNFDGVHLGHRRLLDETASRAKAAGIASAVWTFEQNSHTPCFLTDRAERLRLFRDAGIEYAVLEDFTAVRDYTPERFVMEILRPLGCRETVCGFNFRFGAGASGDTQTLCRLMDGHCFVCEPVMYANEPISSTRVREALEHAEIADVTAMLGRPYAFELPVVHGRMVGRRLQIPTVNQSFPAGMVVPAHGVYATRCILPDEANAEAAHGVNPEARFFRAVTNIGIRPTFPDTRELTCESHLLDYAGDSLYGRTVRLELVAYLRPERKFDTPITLKAQIKRDIERALELLS